MKIKQIQKLVEPQLNQQTIYQLNQMKKFVDTSITNCIMQKFENDSEKIQYLLRILNDIRDFSNSQSSENSLRISLLAQVNKINEEELLGNDESQQEKSYQKIEESLEENQKKSPIKEEVKFESTPNS